MRECRDRSRTFETEQTDAKRLKLSQAKADSCQGRAKAKQAEKLPGGNLEARQRPRGLHHCIEVVLNFQLPK